MSRQKKSGRLSFRIPPEFDAAIFQLVSDSGWTRSEIGEFGLKAFWPDICALALATSPTTDPAELECNREIAKLFRSARTYGLDLRAILVRALEETLAAQAAGKTSGNGTPPRA